MSINQANKPLHASAVQKVLRVAVNTPLRRQFDYLSPANFEAALIPGMRVRVSFGKRELIGLILSIHNESELDHDELKTVVEVIDEAAAIDEHLLKICHWAAAYYHYPIGQVLYHVLPAHARKGKKLSTIDPEKIADPEFQNLSSPLSLNAEQEHALNTVHNGDGGYHCYLLEGVTGSGKTEVYLQLIARKLQAGLQVLVLVPEISLTPQTLARFQERFSHYQIVTLHSGLTDKQRFEAWQQARDGRANIIIGTRSAVFVPMLKPGLIIVDEEHDASYKQQEGFRYSARDLAVYRAQLAGIPILLGSATPSLESIHNAQNGRYTLLSLEHRATKASQPTFSSIDLKGKALSEGFSQELLDAIAYHLENRRQVLVFLNRRGFAPLLQCHDCGWTASCPRCDVSYTLHRRSPELRCHRCESQKKLPAACPGCQSQELLAIGQGTERTELALESRFPAFPIFRIDRDTTKNREKLESTLSAIQEGKPGILLGTQMLAKGHHFPKVSLVAIMDADAGLFSADFRAQEFMGQLLIQVAGRAGREQDPGEVLIQTHNSTHPALLMLTREGYKPFSRHLLAQRELGHLPPFSFQALVRAEASKASLAESFLNTVKKSSLQQAAANKVMQIGPLPSPMEKRAGRFRFQLILQSENRASLHNLLKHLLPTYEALPLSRKVRWSIDIDPLDFS